MKLTIARASETCIFRIQGKVGWESSRLLDREVRQSVEQGGRFLVFDLDGIEFLSSGAIGVLVYHLRRLQSGKGDIFIVTANNYVMYLFRTIGFHKVFEGKIFRGMAELQPVLAAQSPGWAPPVPDAWREVDAGDGADDEISHKDELG
ncbi:MAG TPA: STAS domain-containing protein [Fibrobacteria bacterium]|nr:STAS domain-containing protein [Fibrobacteria bacterium]HOX52010.1 STAS domain-containing protein [Fibrobacteria bacterium]